MNKFHSTVSRRDFMKGLGLGAAGLGAATAAVPVFHDLDELMSSNLSSSSSPSAIHNLPWWVKERDYEDPTVEIDWSQIMRLDRAKYMSEVDPRPGAPFGIYRCALGTPDVPDISKNPGSTLENFIKEKHPEWKGTQTRDTAMAKGGGALMSAGIKLAGGFLGNTSGSPTNEDLGIPKHQGTPEENLKMCRAYLRLIGAFDVGCVPFTTNTRKLVWLTNWSGPNIKEYRFTGDEEPSETETAFNIPNNLSNVLVFSVLNNTVPCLAGASNVPGSARGGPSIGNGGIGVSLGYNRTFTAMFGLMNFLKVLGYHSVNGASTSLSPAPPFGLLSGIGEGSRMASAIVSPKYGSTIRTLERCPTDLPLAPTKPIDAGINKFCETCGICAEDCPFGALGGEKPSWDHHLADEPVGNGNAPGYKGWRLDIHRCNYCGICQSVCPFNSVDGSWVHGPIQATIATTGIFNGFFANMEKSFGYGYKNPETWWDEEQPVYSFKKEWLGGD